MKQVKRFRKVLRGLEGVTVWVHEPEEDALADGLSRQHLQDAVTIRLLDSGIRALGIGNVPEPVGNPWLNIFLNTVKAEHAYFFAVTVRLDEVVRPERNKVLRTIGTTWEASERGVLPLDRLSEGMDRVVDRMIDYFVYDYQMENTR